jgi:AcrR family transcriptional regulator
MSIGREEMVAMTDARADEPNAPLSRERVLEVAVGLADAEGIEGLSMRRLGRALGAGAMTLYSYVANKEELLDGMVDLVFAEVEAAADDVEWREAMRRQSASLRSALMRHRWAIALMESRTNPGPANMQHREAVTACLRRAGFSIRMTAHANWLLSGYVYGYVVQEAALPFETSDELAAMADEVYVPLLSPERYPYLTETAMALLADGYDHTEEFDFGLDLVLNALERVRREEGR